MPDLYELAKKGEVTPLVYVYRNGFVVGTSDHLIEDLEVYEETSQLLKIIPYTLVDLSCLISHRVLEF